MSETTTEESSMSAATHVLTIVVDTSTATKLAEAGWRRVGSDYRGHIMETAR